MIYELPITSQPSQEFTCELAGIDYIFRIVLNVRGDIWTLSVSTVNDYPIIDCVPMVLGADLLANERFTDGILFIADYNNTGLDPTGDNLTDYGLIWYDGVDEDA